MAISFLLLFTGLGIMVFGAHQLVAGASAIALRAGLTPLVVGLTIVAFGTSAPELAISVKAALDGQADLAVGNVVGSNIFNVLFILGLAAVLRPLVVARQLIRIEVPVMIFVSVAFLVMASDGLVSFSESVILLAGFFGYNWFQIKVASREPGSASPTDEPKTKPGVLRSVAMLAVGLGLLVFGSRLFVDAAVAIATALGVSEAVIGLTIVAAGTSMPEVVTSVVATIKGETEIAVGNVVGSNILNILGVAGFSGVLAGQGLPVSAGIVHFDILVMIACAIACLPVFMVGQRIERWEGALFLGYYVAYTAYLILTATQHPSLMTFTEAMIWFVIPLTGVTMTLLSARTLRKRKLAR